MKFDGQSISYDGAGNPTSYYNGTRWSFTWGNGRSLTAASGGGKTLSFTYDLQDGTRSTKTVGSEVHNYIYAGGKLLRETYGNTKLDFIYDVNGRPYAMIVNETTTYYYITNLQGDVINVVNSSGTTVASYEYDPYGYPVVEDETALGFTNPLRYRGYYWDAETEMYLCGSRYYDPAVGRFINADDSKLLGANGDFISYNLFAYCGNNPVSRKDQNGTLWNYVIGAVVGGVVAAITTAVTSENASLAEILISGAVGAVSGAVAASGLGMVAQALVTAGVTFAGDVSTQVVCEGKSLTGKNSVDYKKAAWNSGLSALTSIGGSMLGSVTSMGYMSLGDDMLTAGSEKLLSGYVRQSAGQSYSHLIKQGRNLVNTGTKLINTARGVSSVTGTVSMWGVGVTYSK